ncbi:siderophore ABC transporter substrate-binding protein [Radiobacillus kanasensis]|uniref:siderophore ABC transporter substrate-binding protein n=1 Tax=Radiobacillus kanasensis TaxID=2844358 RepID=UPI001E292D60|nr:siderophore ABC transporter substrate-binding protein [Radiobacillus kanasensis]UFT98279.1 siderophore ABC transporter substrate-binding protein [Radiobacillus kanasensis]
MKKIVTLIFLLLVSIFVAACGSDTSTSSDENSAEASEEKAKTITVKHELGETEVPVNPEKVVVFDYSTLDTLDALGVDVTAVPQDNLPDFLSKFESDEYENAGTLFEPDFEKLSEIDPDLIIIAGRTSEAYEDLQELAPTIMMSIDSAKFVDSFSSNVTLLGEIFGKEAEAEEQLTAIKDEINATKEKAEATGQNGLIILTNDGGVSAYGPGSRFGFLHDALGFAPADDTIEVSTHGQNVSFEYIAETNPDFLFVVDRNKVVGGEYSAEKTLDNELVNGTTAAQEEQIVYLNPDFWYLSGGGITSVSEMIKEVSSAIE